MIAGAWHLAVKAKDIDAMASIAAADNLPDQVLSAVMKRNEIPIAVSYLTRPGLDIQERATRILAEERAGVLAGLLESPSLTNDDRTIIAAKLISKPTRALAEAVLADHSMPLDAVAIAVIQLDNRLDSLTDPQRRNLRAQIKRVSTNPTATATVAGVVNSYTIIERLFSDHPEVDKKIYSDAFNRVIEPKIIQSVKAGTTPNTVYHLTRELRNFVGSDGNYFPEVVYEALKRNFDSETTAKIWTELVGASRASEADSQSDYSARMLAAATTADQDLIKSLLDDVLQGEHTLTAPLAMNPNLSVPQLEGIIQRIDDRLLLRRLPLVVGDDNQVMAIYKNAYESALRHDQWKSFTDIPVAQRTLLSHFIDRWYQNPGSAYSQETRAVLGVLETVNDVELFVGMIPWVLAQGQTGSYGSETILKGFSTIQSRHLGDDLKKWETAATLADNFSGTVEELFYTAATL
jgi:hypothetical protein